MKNFKTRPLSRKEKNILHNMDKAVEFVNKYKAGKVNDVDITDKLTDEQLKELKTLAEEDENKDVQSLDNFKKATHKWRTK